MTNLNVFNPDNFTTENVEKVYIGRDHGCRCGCHGTYTYTEDDTTKVKKLLTRAKNLILIDGAEITDAGKTYTNISFGKNRAICIYWL